MEEGKDIWSKKLEVPDGKQYHPDWPSHIGCMALGKIARIIKCQACICSEFGGMSEL